MQEKDEITLRLTTESIGPLLVRFSLPAIISMAAMSIYNIIGSIFIGHGVGSMALAAMGITFPLMNLIFAFSLLIGIGGASYTSIHIGEKNMGAAYKVLGNVFLLDIINSVFVAALMLVFLDPLLRFFGASDNTAPYAAEFMKIMLVGAPITFSMFNLNHLIRASGYPTKAMLSILLSVFLNAVLGALFIFGFKWGMKGAALATILAQAGALVWVLFHFVRKDSLLHFEKGIFHLEFAVIKRIFYVGLSPCLVNVCGCLVAVFINEALWRFQGDLGIGAFGIMNRVLLLFVMVVVGVAQGMQPIVGFNYGAGRMDRARSALYYAMGAATVITTAGFLLAELCPGLVAELFTDDRKLSSLAVDGLRIGMAMFPLVGSQIIIQQFFQFIGRPKISIFLSVTRQMLLLIPLLILLPRWFESDGVWGSLALADVLSFLLAALMLVVFQRSFRRSVPKPTVL